MQIAKSKCEDNLRGDNMIDFFNNALVVLSKYIKNESGGFVEEEKINRIQRILLKSNYMNSDIIKIILVGEFKSGKSTLINAFCNAEIAAVDFFEMTSWVCTIFPSKEPLCSIQYSDGTNTIMMTEDFIKNCKNRTLSSNEISNIDGVEIGIVNDKLKFAFIDTPGNGIDY